MLVEFEHLPRETRLFEQVGMVHVDLGQHVMAGDRDLFRFSRVDNVQEARKGVFVVELLREITVDQPFEVFVRGLVVRAEELEQVDVSKDLVLVCRERWQAEDRA